MDTSNSSSGPGGVAPGDQEDDWQREAEAFEVKDDDLREFYQAALEGSKYDSAELHQVHLFSSKAQATLDPRSHPLTLSLPLTHHPSHSHTPLTHTQTLRIRHTHQTLSLSLSLTHTHTHTHTHTTHAHTHTHTHIHTHTQVGKGEGYHERDETTGGISACAS